MGNATAYSIRRTACSQRLYKDIQEFYSHYYDLSAARPGRESQNTSLPRRDFNHQSTGTNVFVNKNELR